MIQSPLAPPLTCRGSGPGRENNPTKQPELAAKTLKLARFEGITCLFPLIIPMELQSGLNFITFPSEEPPNFDG
jgi:hypothetical protein